MAIGAAAAFLGIDIGASGVKAVLMAREPSGRMRLLECVSESCAMPRHAAGLEPDTVAESLRRILKKIPALPRRTRVGVAITGQSAFVRLVKIPAAGSKKLRQIILYETQQQIPFPVSDVVWDFQVCGRSQQQLQVLLAAVKKDLINSLITITEAAGLDIEFIDVSNLALYNCLEYFYPNLNRTLIVDIGAKTTNLVVVSEGKIWTRSLPIGGDDMTEAISRHTGIDIAAAEELKQRQANEPVLPPVAAQRAPDQGQKVSAAITDVLTDLNNEIVKTLKYYRSQDAHAGEFIKVLLTGGVSRTKNLAMFLQSSLSLPVEKINFFNFVAFNPRINLHVNEEIGSAIGLALRGMGRSALSINLLPEEQLQIREFRQKQAGILGGILCLVLSACFWAGTQWFRLDRSQKYVQQLQLQAQRFADNKQKLAAFESQMAQLKRQTAGWARVLVERHQAVAVWDAVARALPDGLWLTRMEFVPRSAALSLRGAGDDSLETVGAFQERLKQDPQFGDVRLDTMGKDADGKLTFSVSVTLARPGEDL